MDRKLKAYDCDGEMKNPNGPSREDMECWQQELEDQEQKRIDVLRDEVKAWMKLNGGVGAMPWRSCWNCNPAHGWMKLNTTTAFNCFECGHIYSQFLTTETFVRRLVLADPFAFKIIRAGQRHSKDTQGFASLKARHEFVDHNEAQRLAANNPDA